MQFNTFEIGEELKLSFNLNISGTNAQPSEVRVILGDKLKLQTAAHLGAGGEWEAVLPILPDLFTHGDTTLNIEVVINGKMFTPVKQRVIITGSTVSVNAQTTIPEPQVATVPNEDPSFGSQEHELAKQPVNSVKPISIADLMSAAGIKYEHIETIEPVIEPAPIVEEVIEPVEVKPEPVVEPVKVKPVGKQIELKLKESKKPKKSEPLQLDISTFVKAAEVTKPVENHFEQKIIESTQKELKKVKVSTGNFRIEKTKIVTKDKE